MNWKLLAPLQLDHKNIVKTCNFFFIERDQLQFIYNKKYYIIFFSQIIKGL